MAVTEPERLKMHQDLIETMGEEQAARLMAHLPLTGWADVATKQDVEGLRAATKQDVEGLRAATKQDIEGLRAATKQDIEGLRELTTVRFEAIEQRMATKQDIAELRAHMDETLRKQLVTVVTCMVGLVTGTAGLLGVGAALF